MSIPTTTSPKTHTRQDQRQNLDRHQRDIEAEAQVDGEAGQGGLALGPVPALLIGGRAPLADEGRLLQLMGWLVVGLVCRSVGWAGAVKGERRETHCIK